jgi:hypothetical protein
VLTVVIEPLIIEGPEILTLFGEVVGLVPFQEKVPTSPDLKPNML